MKGKNLLLLGGGAAVLYYLSTKAYNIRQAVKKISFTNPRITAKPDIKLLRTVFTLSLEIVNPGSADIAFEYYAGTIIYAGKKISDFRFDGVKTLRSRSKTPVSFEVTVSNPGVITSLVKIIKAIAQKKKIDSIIAVNGSLYAAGIDVPVNFVYDIAKQEQVSGVGKMRFAQSIKQRIIERRQERDRLNIPQPGVIVPAPEQGMQELSPPVTETPTDTAAAEKLNETIQPAAAQEEAAENTG